MISPAKPMIVGVIGCGSMGSNHVRVYSGLRDVHDVLVYDSDPSAADRMLQYGAHSFADLHDMLQLCDMVSICVPTPLHKDVVCAVVAECVPFLVEKPIAGTLEDAYVIDSLDPNPGSGVGHIERFNPLSNAVRDLMSCPRYISIRRHNPGSSRVSDTSVVDDLMIHDVDLVRHLFFGCEPDGVQSSVSDGVAHALLSYDDVVVSLSASRVSANKVRDIVIECDDFTIVGDFMTQELLVYRKPDTTIFVSGEYRQEQVVEKILVPRVEPLKAELSEFVRCVREGDAFPVSVEESVQNMELCGAIKHDRSSCSCGSVGCCQRR